MTSSDTASHQEDLHTLLASNQEVLVFDVRQPLDLLAILKSSLAQSGFPERPA
jgi:hypothetical protein